MAAVVKRLLTKPDRLKAEQAAELRQLLLGFPSGLPERALSELLLTLDRHTAVKGAEWPFVMLSPEQNAEVVRWLVRNSKRPQLAVQLWASLFQHLRRDTGEVIRTRDELATDLNVAPNHVTNVMSELERIGAIMRVRQRVSGMRGPGRVSYFMNPRVATHLPLEARKKAQSEAPRLSLVELTPAE